jgi:2',3'-cyclic-nucleotide 2'-phosphodiesterase (5'-nucleotidase family)
VIDLSLGAAVVKRDARLVFGDSLPRDTSIARMVSAAIAAVGPRLNAPIATIAQDLHRTRGEYPLGNLIVDGMRAAGHADFAAANESGFRADLRAGVATYGALFDIQPFANRLILVTASGAAMRRYFEAMLSTRGSSMAISGAIVTFDTTRRLGSRVVAVTLPNGRELDDRGTYSIVITDFLATGGVGLALPDSSAVLKDLSTLDLDATIAYVKSLSSPVRAPSNKRWVIRPKPQ